jgi:hypothetical protein
VDGHEIEITGNPADGIWIPGLPGEVPDKIGDVLAGPEKKRPVGSRFFHAMVDDANDLFESAGKNADAFGHIQPTHTSSPARADRQTLEATQFPLPDAGNIAQGILALGILAWGSRDLLRRLRGALDVRD